VIIDSVNKNYVAGVGSEASWERKKKEREEREERER
jgi:hypothetical protein